MATFNERIAERVLAHQIDVLKFARGLSRRVVGLLNKTEGRLRDLIVSRADIPFATQGLSLSTRTIARLRRLQEQVQDLRRPAFEEARALVRSELRQLSRQEVDFLARVTAAGPIEVDVKVPPARQLDDILTRQPFRGRVLRDWASKIERDDLARIMARIRIGLIEGRPAAEIARTIVGTVRLRGTNGVTQITRREATALVRTATTHVAARSRSSFALANRDLYPEEIYLAVLDGRTTIICRDLDGSVHKVGRGPYPPIHFQCRSSRAPFVNGEALARRTVTPTTERQLLREFAEDRSAPLATRRSELPRNKRKAFDRFRTRRLREIVGEAPSGMSQESFLKSLSRQERRDILGKTGERLFSEGGLNLGEFLSRDNRRLTLDQLARRNGEAFRRAGLKPEDFIRDQNNNG